MNFFFAKLFEEYQKKNDSPSFRITLFISLFYFFLLFSILLPLSEVIKKIYFSYSSSYNKSTLTVIFFGILGLITYLVYNTYIKKELIFKLVEKYRGTTINKSLLYFLVFISPVFLLLTGATLTVLLKGGTILNYTFNGIF